jgi:2-polyprenyl-3-methyl-5-hydroxy-6-metoxy-1,4-benzoquinol methylase
MATSIYEIVTCPKCDSASVTVLRGQDYLHGIEGEFSVAECVSCGLWFQNPRPTADSVADLYPDDYLPHTEIAISPVEPSRSSGSAQYLRRRMGYAHLAADNAHGFDWKSVRLLDPVRRWMNGVALLPDFVPAGRLLEVGCGSGGRLLSLRAAGWTDLQGIELIASAAERARSHGLAIQCGPIEDILDKLPNDYFDVIISSMVLEHLRDPFSVVRAIAGKLKRNGQFLFSTVNRTSLDARVYGKYWAGFDFPRHLVYPRTRDLRELLEGDFKEVQVYHQSEPIDFLRSATWRRNDGKYSIVDSLILRLGSSRFGSAASLLLAWLKLTTRVSVRCRRI